MLDMLSCKILFARLLWKDTLFLNLLLPLKKRIVSFLEEPRYTTRVEYCGWDMQHCRGHTNETCIFWIYDNA